MLPLNHWRAQDHPRLRGEKLINSDDLKTGWGSPPLARGKVADFKNRVVDSGITPACAGKRYQSYCGDQNQEDHPRLRGEKGSGGTAVKGLQGSPPLARGKDF